MRIKEGKKNQSEYSDISMRFREVRLDHRMTQREFGEMVGLTAASIGAIEAGLYTPNFKVLRILRQKLNVSYDYLIDGVTNGHVNHARENMELKEENDRLKKIIDKLT